MLSENQYFQFIKSIKVIIERQKPTEERIDLPIYMTLLRIDRPKTKNALRTLKGLPKTWKTNTRVYYVANVFGEWDNCVWFEANDHDHAMDFVQNKISTIPGVLHTYTLPTTPIRKYFRR